MPWSLDPQTLIRLCWPTRSRWSCHRTLQNHIIIITWISSASRLNPPPPPLFFFSTFLTGNQICDAPRKCHPGVYYFCSANFSAFHPYQCEDSPKEAGDDGGDCEGPAGMQEHCGRKSIRKVRFVEEMGKKIWLLEREREKKIVISLCTPLMLSFFFSCISDTHFWFCHVCKNMSS